METAPRLFPAPQCEQCAADFTLSVDEGARMGHDTPCPLIRSQRPPVTQRHTPCAASDEEVVITRTTIMANKRFMGIVEFRNLHRKSHLTPYTVIEHRLVPRWKDYHLTKIER